MKILKKIVGFLSLLLVLGGGAVIAWQYFRNAQLFEVLMNNSVVKGSLGVIEKMGYGLLGIIFGLLLFSVYLKIGSVVRRQEREKKAALRQQQKDDEEEKRKLMKEADEARAEALQARKEVEQAQMDLAKRQEEAEKQVQE